MNCDVFQNPYQGRIQKFGKGGGGGVGALEPTILEKVEKAAVLQETFSSSVSAHKIFPILSTKGGERWGGGGGGRRRGMGPSPKSAPVYSTAHKASI